MRIPTPTTTINYINNNEEFKMKDEEITIVFSGEDPEQHQPQPDDSIDKNLWSISNGQNSKPSNNSASTSASSGGMTNPAAESNSTTSNGAANSNNHNTNNNNTNTSTNSLSSSPLKARNYNANRRKSTSFIRKLAGDDLNSLQNRNSSHHSSTKKEMRNAHLSDDDDSSDDDDDFNAPGNDDSSSSSSSSTTGLQDTDTSQEELFPKEEKELMYRSKILVYVVLIIATAAIATVTYLLLTSEENKAFEKEFLHTSEDCVDRLDAKMTVLVEQTKELSTAFTSHALYAARNGVAWPNITLPDFDRRTHLFSEHYSECIVFAPVVPYGDEESAQWVNYSVQNQGWIDEALVRRGWRNVGPKSIPQEIYSYDDWWLDHNGTVGGENATSRNRQLERVHQKTKNRDRSKEVPLLTTKRSVQVMGGEKTSIDMVLRNNLLKNQHLIHAPLWQLGPVPRDRSIVNLDLHSHPVLKEVMNAMMSSFETKATASNATTQSNQDGWITTALSPTMNVEFLMDYVAIANEYELMENPKRQDSTPRTVLMEAIFDNFIDDDGNDIQTKPRVVGFLFSLVPWDLFFHNEDLPVGTNLMVEVQETCAGTNSSPTAIEGDDATVKKGFAYSVRETGSTYLGDLGSGLHLHDPKFGHLVQRAEFAPGLYGENSASATCTYTLFIYPTRELYAAHQTKDPIVYTVFVVCVFLLTAIVFLVYDCLVTKRQQTLLSQARRTNEIVNSLFPKDVQRRIMAEAEKENEDFSESKNAKAIPLHRRASQITSQITAQLTPSAMAANTVNAVTWVVTGVVTGATAGYVNFTPKSQMKDFLTEEEEKKASKEKETANLLKTKPIADLFPEATIMFADIVGFTAWSSMREPAQVFTLLESIYHAFDLIAKRRRVYKVETVGDCYVAVAGLPEPRKDHATVMARFACDCLFRMLDLVKELEVTLGPDTTELGMRFGLHSGPVTAGVLRGERARFQLFGDTVNTTSRIETTGMRDRIHLSQETAELLTASGKGHWIVPREDKITAKGKGTLQTYWLKVAGETGQGANSSAPSNGSEGEERVHQQALENIAEMEPTPKSKNMSEKQDRLINWNTEVLSKLLREIKARRFATGSTNEMSHEEFLSMERDKMQPKVGCALDEVQEIITLPNFDATVAAHAAAHAFDHRLEETQLERNVVGQLREYVQTIASMYRDNCFHNFEHASHVTMSVVKLLSRIVAPEISCTDDDIASTLHDHTYGITSDPLTQFAVVLSALIHDVDHPGVPNSQLVKEGTELAKIYEDKSVAEQNSVDLAWQLLMDPGFVDLRRSIYCCDSEFRRFRQLVVNTVMATDIMDKDLGALRKARWNKAFSEAVEEDKETAVNRKATIVIEHLIQASDVAHTMQHWHIYRKWNSRFFEEMYKAYKEGRSEVNPADNWYKGEIGFFDFYIIPLAKKLKDCGVFGVSSDEYLNYAQQNRKEWERTGESVVATMIESVQKKMS